MHMQACVYSRYSFFSFYPLITSHHPLVNMIFLNSYSRLSSVIYLFLLFRRFIPTSQLALVLPLLSSLQSHSFLLFLSLLCQFSFHSFVFIFLLFSLENIFFLLFVLPLYCTSSPCPILHYYFLASFFHFVSSHTVLIVSSQLPQFPRYTPQLAR